MKPCLALVALLVVAPPANANDDWQRKSLKGLAGVCVVVNSLPADVEQHGLTADAIKTDVELRLRQSGVRVFTDAKVDPSPAKAFVLVNINIKAVTGLPGLNVSSIDIELHQWLVSAITHEATPGITWSNSSLGQVGNQYLRPLRDSIADKVDVFINDYLAMHPGITRAHPQP